MASKVDPFSFKMYHDVLHATGTHGICILFRWEVPRDVFQHLRKLDEHIGMLSMINHKWYIYDIPVELVPSLGNQHGYPILKAVNKRRMK